MISGTTGAIRGLVLAAALAGWLAPAPAAAAADSAGATVGRFQQALLGVMKQAKALGIRGRFDRLVPVVEQSFNLPVMIATASAPYWKAGTEDQRARLVTAFRRMSIASAATLFDDYGGQSFRTLGERKGRGPVMLVDTQIVQPKDDPVTITYVVAQIRGRWWIVDIVVAGGISEITVRRSEYLALLKEGGLDRLVAALERKADNLLAGREKARAEGVR